MKPERIRHLTSMFFDSFNHLLWPARCLHCDELLCRGSDLLCADCWQSLLNSSGGDYCPSCGIDVSRYAIVAGKCSRCVSSQNNFTQIARAGIYEGVLRSMIIAFKLNDKQEYLSVLSQMLDSALQGVTFAGNIDMIIPVPIHWTRRISRGFNQSKLIASGISRSDLVVDALARIKKTRMQPGLSESKRRRNVRGAFSLRRGIDVAGKNICLVDDIKTSGATLNECADVLKKEGAREVFALVLAVAGQNG